MRFLMKSVRIVWQEPFKAPNPFPLLTLLLLLFLPTLICSPLSVGTIDLSNLSLLVCLPNVTLRHLFFEKRDLKGRLENSFSSKEGRWSWKKNARERKDWQKDCLREFVEAALRGESPIDTTTTQRVGA